MLKRHSINFESGKLDTDFRRRYFFLPSITDRNEEINKYMGSVNIHPIDISKKELGEKIDPSKLDYFNPEKAKITESVLNVLKKMVKLLNTNIIKNAELLNKLPAETDVEWVAKSKKRLPDNKFKITY